MSNSVPDFNLSHGQLLWAINYGRDPDEQLRHNVRYLRGLDIPPASARQASGPGKHIAYSFFDLIETGVAVTGLDLGFRPRDIAAVLVAQRYDMHRLYADTWKSLPESAVEEDWVKSRGRIKVMYEDEIFIRLHDRRSKRWGQIDVVGPDETTDTLPLLEPVERFAGEAPRRLIPLRRLMLQWVAWALDPPVISQGRRKR